MIRRKTPYQWSWSRFLDVSACPWRYHVLYVEKIKPTEGEIPIQFLMGDVLSLAIEKLSIKYSEGLTEKFSEQDLITTLANTSGIEALDPDQRTFVARCLLNWNQMFQYDRNFTLVVEKKMAIDREGRAVDWMDRNVYFRFKLDLGEVSPDLIRVTDWKLGSKSAGLYQVMIYAPLLQERYFRGSDRRPITPSHVRVGYLGSGKFEEVSLTTDAQALVWSDIKNQLSLFEKYLDSLYDAGQTPPPIASANTCSSCSLKNICTYSVCKDPTEIKDPLGAM